MDLAQCDGAICPTRWQADQFPHAMQRNLSVIFDGVDTQNLPLVLQNERNQALVLEEGNAKATIPPDVPLVTYVTRCFEPTEDGPRG